MKPLLGGTMAFLGTLLFIFLGAWFFSFEDAFEFSSEQSANILSQGPPETDDPFLLAQYHFNHGPDADGAYDLGTARYYYEKAIEEDSEHENKYLWYQLGRIDFLEGKYSTAIHKFNKQLEYFDDEIHNVYYMLGLTYGFKAKDSGLESDWNEAEAGFQKFIEYEPKSPWPRIDLSWIYFSQGKYEEMRTLLEETVNIHGDNPWFNNMYGLALLNTEGKKAARPYFEKALEGAEQLTIEDWGRSYPGNDPRSWESGLRQMREAIRKNLELTNSQ